MDGISPIGSLVSRMQELANSQPAPSIADVVGSPDPTGLEAVDPSEFTARYEMGILANTLRASADMQLALIQMLTSPGPERA